LMSKNKHSKIYFVFWIQLLLVHVINAFSSNVSINSTSALFPYQFLNERLQDLLKLNFQEQSIKWISTIIILYATNKAYKIFFTPMCMRFTLADTEKTIEKLKRNANTRMRKTGQIPPPFPTGWFKLLSSSDLKIGEVKYIQMFGEHYVTFRGQNGKVGVMDAYCPHLGANLGIGGKVVGNCVECPFHGWQFDTKGQCTHIPNAESVPTFAKTKSYPVIETCELILIYYDQDGNEPTWKPPEIETSYHYHGKFEHQVAAHIQEIPENGADVAHLGILHGNFMFKWVPFIKHKWISTWSPGEDHCAHIVLKQQLLLFGIPILNADVTATQTGPGLVYISFDMAFGKALIIETVTPKEALLQETSHIIFASRFVPRFVAKILLYFFYEQFNRDVYIWSNKTFLPNAFILKQDGNIAQFRKFYQRFYPKKVKQEKLDW